ncbi:MAG: hypothetical protein IJG62_05240 [Synergistaceae bacterium]|nr:hypothetical protein [Synergistaceae bacterium]
MLKYVNFRVDGLTKQDAHKILRKLFKDDKAERVINDFLSKRSYPNGILRTYMRLSPSGKASAFDFRSS